MVHEIIDFVKCFFDFEPHEYQEAFLTACCYESRVAALWARQLGKSTAIANYCNFVLLTRPNTTIIIISPKQRQSSELYLKIRDVIERSSLLSNFVTQSTQTELKLVNGSRIISLPSGHDGGSIKGFTGDIVILEECGMMKDSIVNEVVMPMIASKPHGQVIKIGTPKGKNNFWQSCFGRETKYKLFHVDYKEGLRAGQYGEEFINEQKNNLTELEFKTEYEAQFIEDSDCYFKQELIEDCIVDYELWEEGCTHFSINHKYCQYYLGADFARLGEDTTILSIYEKRADDIRLAYVEEIKHKKLTVAIGRIKQLDAQFDFLKMCLDETGIGAGPTDMLEEEFGNRIQGVTFTVKSKENMYSNMKKIMEQGKLKFPMIKRMFYEISDLRYELTSSGNTKIHHAEGGHDDYPDSAVLALWAAKEDSYAFGGKRIF